MILKQDYYVPEFILQSYVGRFRIVGLFDGTAVETGLAISFLIISLKIKTFIQVFYLILV